MAKLKVCDLPKEEQDALVQEAQNLGLRGILTAWGVDTLKAKIEELKAQKSGDDSEKDDQKEGENSDKANQKEGENLDNVGQKEGNIETIVAGDGGVHEVDLNEQEAETGEQKAEANEQDGENVEQNDGENEQNKEPEKLDNVGQVEPKREEEPKICHICRGKVYNGKCSDCGFERRV